MSSLERAVIPDSIQLDFTEDYLWYQEEYVAEDEEMAQTVAEETIALFENVSERLFDESSLDGDIETNIEATDGTVIADFTMKPGHPNGSKSFGTVGLACEFMSLLAMTQPDLWDMVVSFTEDTAKSTKKRQILDEEREE